jgi:hypothetical protein
VTDRISVIVPTHRRHCDLLAIDPDQRLADQQEIDDVIYCSKILKVSTHCSTLWPSNLRVKADYAAALITHFTIIGATALCTASSGTLNVAVGSFSTEMVKAQARPCPLQLR